MKLDWGDVMIILGAIMIIIILTIFYIAPTWLSDVLMIK